MRPLTSNRILSGRRFPNALCPFFCILLIVFGLVPPISAQDDGDGERDKATKSKKESPMKGQNREFEGDSFLTKEQHPVKLSAAYYFGNADKETVPVLLLHDANGSRRDFAPLITMLTNNGYAVLAPDLRGHGKSVKRYEIIPAKIEMKEIKKQRSGSGSGSRKPKVTYEPQITEKASTKLIDYLAEDFQPLDYAMMFAYDLPLLKHKLKEAHTAGLINLNRLVVVGVGRGAALAAFWTLVDWKDKDSDRFTKTLVLIAPSNLISSPAALAGSRSTMGQAAAASPMQQLGFNPAILADMTRGFGGNRMLRDHLAVFTAVPQEDASNLALADKIRHALLDKEAEEDKGGMESKYPVYTYTTRKTVKGEKGETTAEMTLAETFSSPQAKLGLTVFQFIDRRNKDFKEKENRWTKLK